jgi:hypothetical protein
MGGNYRGRLLDKSERYGRDMGQSIRHVWQETYHPHRPGQHDGLFLDMGHVNESSHGDCFSGCYGEHEWKW